MLFIQSLVVGVSAAVFALGVCALLVTAAQIVASKRYRISKPKPKDDGFIESSDFGNTRFAV